ncbi:MAG: TrkA family potassium uptake protein [Spirochaetia bacterium]|jgi:trk system potassium uptake protein TrkA|nr:TrkA family potassium uptake protein [Spirochaetia bacterium]
MDKVFAVIGLGSFGRQLCATLMEKGGKVIAIDNNPDLVDTITDKVTSAILLDSTDEKALSGASLGEVDFAIVAIGDNIEASILTTAILKQLSIPYVVARAVSEMHQKVLKKVGADEVVNLEVDGGIRVASRLIAPEVLDRVPISTDISLAELFLPKEFKGEKSDDLQLKKKFSLSLVMIRRTVTDLDEEGNPVKKDILIQPEENRMLEESDVLIVVGKNSDIDEFIGAGE